MRFHRTLAVLTFSALVGCMPQVDRATPLTETLTLRMDSTRDTSGLLIHLSRSYVAEYPNITILTEIDDPVTWFVTPEERRGLLVSYHYASTHGDLRVVPLVRDGLVFVTHDEVGVEGLSLNQLRGIYQGIFTSWDMLGGDAVEITPLVRSPQADLQQEFRRLVMGQRRITPNARVVSSSEQVHEIIRQEAGTVAFITLSQFHEWLQDEPLMRLMTVDSVLPSQQTISDNRYPLPLTIFAMGTEDLASPYGDFIFWVQSESAQALIESGFVPLQ